MIPIRNQPITFPTYHTYLTQDSCYEGDYERKPLIFEPTDTIRVQWYREASDPINCPLIAPSSVSQLITNGDFSDGDTGWNYDPAQWDLSGGNAECILGTANSFSQFGLGLVNGNSYLVTYTVVVPGGENVFPSFGGGTDLGTTQTASGTYSDVITYTGAGDVIQFTASDVGVIVDDISVVEVIEENECWTFPGWDYTSTGLSHQDGETTPITYSGLTIGQHYKLEVTGSTTEVGMCLVKNDSQVLGLFTNDQNTFYFIATHADLTFEPTEDYVGTFTAINILEHDYFPSGSIDFTNECGITLDLGGDLAEAVLYYKDYATLVLNPDDYGAEDCCSYKITFTDTDEEETQYDSVQFEIKEDVECIYKWVEAYNDCDGWGFNYHDYKHGMRVPIRFTNPTYSFQDTEDTDSSGTYQPQYDERSKSWLVRTPKGMFMDEAFHDAFSIMLKCTHLGIDGQFFTCLDGSYKPNWPETGEGQISNILFNLSPKEDTLFKRIAGCYPHQYILRVLKGWAEVDYFKPMDGYKNMHWEGSVYCLESLQVDINDGYGLQESLTAPEYYTLNTVETTPTGVNGNVMFTGSKGTDLSLEIPQSLNTWINEILDNRRIPVQFYDDLSVVHYREDVQFYLRISVQYPNELAMQSGPYEFTNEGKTSTGLDPIHASYHLDYVE